MLDDAYKRRFSHGRYRRYCALHDFRLFKRLAEKDAKEIASDLVDFEAMSQVRSFYVHQREETAVQIGFGLVPLGRKSVAGKDAIEDGASLVYSLGPSGDVSAMLFPAKSDVARVKEDVIFLRIGRYGAMRLHEKLRKDMSDLHAYQEVTALDFRSTLQSRMRVWRLRKQSHLQIDGKFKHSELTSGTFSIFWNGTSKLMATILLAILKPIGLAIALLILLQLGFPEVVELLVKGKTTE